jgi:hypothetical protein
LPNIWEFSLEINILRNLKYVLSWYTLYFVVDVNECSSSTRCNAVTQRCTNYPGTYRCYCNSPRQMITASGTCTSEYNDLSVFKNFLISMEHIASIFIYYMTLFACVKILDIRTGWSILREKSCKFTQNGFAWYIELYFAKFKKRFYRAKKKHYCKINNHFRLIWKILDR